MNIMTLLETIKLLEHIATNQPNVNGIVETGDIYDLSKDEYQQKYSAFCVTQNTHNVGEEFTTYSFTLFYVDRLTLDKSNKLEIQSTAVQFFANFIRTVMQDYSNLDWTNGDVTTFTEKFSAECAGAYMTCSITTTNKSLCKLYIEEMKKKGEYSPKAYSKDYFVWMQHTII